jgi:hypothetical protein
MSCGCSSGSSYDGGIYGGVCDADTPYPSVSHESVPSLIDNLVYALYGVITKDVTSGKVVWNIPCDPSNIPATINGIPRNDGEGLLCYIVRALNLTTPSGFVTVDGVQTLTNKTLTAPVINNMTATGTLTGTLAGTATTAINIAGGLAGSIPYQTGVGLTTLLPQGTAGQVLSTNGSGALGWITNSTTSSATNNVNGGTAGVIVYQTGVNTTGFTAAGTSGQVLLSNGTSAPTWSTNIAGQAGSVANGSVTPAKLSTGGPSWDASGNVGIGTTSPSSKLSVAGSESTGAGVSINVYNSNTGALSASQLLASNGNGVAVQLQTFNNFAVLNCVSNSDLQLRTNNTERLTIAASGSINAQANPITNCPTTAKAWGGATSAGVIDAQTFNVVTIARSALGNYLVTTAQPIVGHQIVATPKTALGAQATAAAVSITQFRVFTFGGGGAAADFAFQFVVFGD